MSHLETATKPKTSPPSRNSSRSHTVQAILGLVVVAFIGGSAVTEFRVFPYRQVLQPSFIAARSLHQRIDSTSSLRGTDFWSETEFTRRGVTSFDPGKSEDGYTLYTSGHESSAFLIDREGKLMHKWHLPFRQAWNEPTHVDHPVPERFIYWRRAHLFPNGDLLAIYVGYGDTPWGYGLVKIDHESNVIWRFAEHVHHDLCVDPHGSIYTLTHAFRDSEKSPVAGMPHLRRALLDDFVVKLHPTANSSNESRCWTQLPIPIIETCWRRCPRSSGICCTRTMCRSFRPSLLPITRLLDRVR